MFEIVKLCDYMQNKLVNLNVDYVNPIYILLKTNLEIICNAKKICNL